MAAKSSSTLSAILAVMAALLVVGSVGLFWVAWKGVQFLRHEAAHVATVVIGDASVLVGKTEWIGTWEGGGTKMTIDSNGHADYGTKSAHGSEELHGSLSFDGSDVVIDVLVMQKHLHVDVPPHLDGARWLVTVDGVELERR